MSDGTRIIPPTGQKVIFHFREIFLDTSKEFTATPEFVSAQSKAESTVLTVKDNVEKTVILSTPEITRFAKDLRRPYKTRMGVFSNAVIDNDFHTAEKEILAVLRTSKSPIAKQLLKQFQELSPEDKKIFMQDLQRYSSGSDVSRKIGESIRNNPNALSSNPAEAMNQVESLYKKGLAKGFGAIYGASERDIMSQFQKMRSSLQISTLKEAAPNSLAIVSYSQLRGDGTRIVHGAGRERNMNAQFVGNMVPVEGGSLQNGVKQKLKIQLFSQIQELRRMLPQDTKATDQEIISLMVDGQMPQSLSEQGYSVSRPPQIQSYLSFEPNAECFNMGFVLTPVGLVHRD